MTIPTQEHVLVIGGGGFLGSTLVKLLLDKGITVSIFDLRPPKNPDPRLLESNIYLGDITELSSLLPAFTGKAAVIHTASPPHGKSASVYHLVNVKGTENVIQACRETGVRKLVYTSSASVIFDGTDLVSGSERDPYCKVHMDAYNETKALGEAMVLKANDPAKDFYTCALRPSGIFGPNDMQAVAAMVEAAKRGQWRVMIGDNENLFDMTYVENVAYAHWLALDQLVSNPSVNGQTFTITNDQPMFFWDFMKALHHEMGYRNTQSIRIPRPLGLVLGTFVDTMAALLSPIVTIHPSFTAFRVKLITANRFFDIRKAKDVLGYAPIVGMDEAIRRTVASLS